MFGNVCRDIPGELYEEAIAEQKNEAGVTLDTELSADDLRALVARFRDLFREHRARSSPGSARPAAPGDPGRVRLLAR